MVEVFTLTGHAKAKRAYGWRTGTGEDVRYTAILELPPWPHQTPQCGLQSRHKRASSDFMQRAQFFVLRQCCS